MATLVYIDETAPVGTNLDKQPLLRLAAVLVPEDKVMLLAERLRELALTHLAWVPADFEWHGQELWNGTGPWDGRSPPELLAAYGDVIDLLNELDLRVAHAIDKLKLHDKYQGQADGNAYRLGLHSCLRSWIRTWQG